MREILFRGKRTDNSKWIEGCFLDKNNIGIFYDDTEESDCAVHVFQVIPKTIGQYTGLTDKNGNKIFEGDILKERGTDAFYVIKWKNAGFETNDIDLNYGYPLEIGSDKEVIGNTFDNPELLKEAERE